MGLLKDTIQKKVEEKTSQYYTSTIATITKYNIVTNRADIRYTDPNGGGSCIKKEVPVVINMTGIQGASITPGKQCYISFSNGNVYNPIITGVIDSDYSKMNIINTGGCVVEEDTLEAELPEDFTPMSDTWIDEENADTSKYLNQYSEQYVVDGCDSRAHEIARNITHMTDDDQGIVSLINGSMIRVKDNGDIELFTDNNVGIRISKDERKIYLYGLVIETENQS